MKAFDLVERFQRSAGLAGPCRQRGPPRVDAAARVDRLLQVVRQVIDAAADERVRDEAARGHAAFDQFRHGRRLLEELRVAHGDGSFGRRLAQLACIDLLAIDDFAIAPITAAERNDLLELLDDRIGTGATLIASQLPVTAWHEWLTRRPWPTPSWIASCTPRT